MNSFGSVTWLTQSQSGAVSGTYASTTGASGAYWVVGFADPSPQSGMGQALALSISWLSFQGGDPNASWHYVSGMCGQAILLQDIPPTLILMHDMVASIPMKDVVATAGSYLDKLLFIPYQGGTAAPGQWPPPFIAPPSPQPVAGNWKCVQDPATTLQINFVDQKSGYVDGTMTSSAGTSPLVGFADPNSFNLPAQALALSTMWPGGTVATLSGSLDFKSQQLTLMQMTSVGTLPANTWLQTMADGLNFMRA
jgi:hypothetical protein